MDNFSVTSVEQLKSYIGQDVSLGQWITVTQEMVTRFADATGDQYFIHVDPVRARESKFGGTVAHGFFTLSMLAGFLIEGITGMQLDLPAGTNLNYGLNKVRFIEPVPVGRRIRVRIRLKAVNEDPVAKWVQIVRESIVELDGSTRPAMTAETVTRRYFQ